MAISSTAASSGSAFNVDGVISGLKTADIIAQMMKLSQVPLNQINAQQARVQQRDSAYQAISSQMITFQGSVQNLLLSTSINTKISASLLPSVATATASSGAINGSFSITVGKLATATSASSSSALGTPANQAAGAYLTRAGATGATMTTTPTAGSFTINGQKVSLASDGSETWATLKDKISKLSGPAVSLNFDTITNGVSLTSSSPVQLGSPGDTSNFLSATRLLSAAQTGSAGTYTVASNQLLGEAQATSPLSSAGLSTAITPNGTFQVNGVSIAWASTDSLSDVVSRINSSAAGVTAMYDPKLDKVSLTNSNTGAQSISLVDGAAGGLLAALNLTAATQAYGNPAEYTTTQNGVTSATTQYSNSNTITGVVQGVNVTLLGAGTTSISTTQDTATATTNVNAFVTQFNSMVDLLDTSTKYDPNTKTAGILAGDSSITALASQLRSLVSRSAVAPPGSAYSTLGDVGISTGAYGSAVGSTNHLILDSTKLGSALLNNPQAVMQVLAGLTGTTAVASSPSWMQTVSGTPFGQVNSGSYKVTFNPAGNTLSAVFTASSGTISPAVTGKIAAGGTNSTLIPGVSIVALGTLPGSSSTDTINYSVTGRGVLQSLNDYVSHARGPSGIFASEHADATTSIATFTAQIAHQNILLSQRQATLQAQFTAMEVALTRLQSQGAALSSSLGVAITTAAANSASSSSSG